MSESFEIVTSGNNILTTSIYPSAKVEVIQEKIKDVPKDEQIKLNDDTIYRFFCTVKNNCLFLKLYEIGAFAPYIYETLITLDKMREINIMFNACNTIDEVSDNINVLFKKGNIKLSKENDNTISLNITAFLLSKVDTFKIELQRKITSEKDDTLNKLYEIQKKEIKLWKEMEKFLKGTGGKGNSILSKMNDIKKKYDKSKQ